MNIEYITMTDEDLRICWRNMMRWHGGGGPRYFVAHVTDARIMTRLAELTAVEQAVTNMVKE